MFHCFSRFDWGREIPSRFHAASKWPEIELAIAQGSDTSPGVIVIFDLEWTSWPGFQESGWKFPGKQREVIQIGAVKLVADLQLTEKGSFNRLVQPILHPRLDDYIVELTGITQERIDHEGRSFQEAVEEFASFIGPDVVGVISNGRDGEVIQEICTLHDIPVPEVLQYTKDIRPSLAFEFELPLSALDSADLPGIVGVESDEIPHDALGDARSVAILLRHLWRTRALR